MGYVCILSIISSSYGVIFLLSYRVPCDISPMGFIDFCLSPRCVSEYGYIYIYIYTGHMNSGHECRLYEFKL